jgi:hypothetical protein
MAPVNKCARHLPQRLFNSLVTSSKPAKLFSYLTDEEEKATWNMYEDTKCAGSHSRH